MIAVFLVRFALLVIATTTVAVFLVRFALLVIATTTVAVFLVRFALLVIAATTYTHARQADTLAIVAPDSEHPANFHTFVTRITFAAYRAPH